jgi:hypothetical protein
MSDTRSPDPVLRAIAEVGALVCCYLPGYGDPEKWPESRCDCKYGTGPMPDGEATGCPELRDLYDRARGGKARRWPMLPARALASSLETDTEDGGRE